MKKSLKLLVISLIFPIVLISSDDLDIDNLLTSIEKKSDLSSKTKLENGGISHIYTRDDLNRMQVNTLSDVVKSFDFFGYRKNRFGLSDPMSVGTNHAFLSSYIRVMIDNQEITTSLYGSGLILYGDIDMEFVDHVEIYTQNPSFEFSTEPTFILIKLFSKRAIKDAGGKVKQSVGSYGSNNTSFYHSSELSNDWSYFTYASFYNDKEKKYNSFGTELSRDKKTKHLFTSFYNDNNNIILDVLSREGDGFADFSLDATPQKSKLDIDNIHIGYDTKYNNISFLTSFSRMKTDTAFLDDINNVTSQFTKSTADVYSNELKYTYDTKSNNLIIGGKFRFKKFKYDELKINGVEQPRTGHTKQVVKSIFLENQYSIKDNSIITAGINYSDAYNNSSVQQEELTMYRLGHTYTTENFVFKTLHSHIESLLEPYLVNSFLITPGKKESQKVDSFMENIIYEKGDNKYELMLNHSRVKNFLAPNTNGLLDNSQKEITVFNADIAWTYHYNEYDKFYTSFSYSKKRDMLVPLEEEYVLNIKNINTIGKFDIYNEFLAFESTHEDKFYYDYGLGIKYNYSDDFIISLKGNNLFNEGRKREIIRTNPQNGQTLEPLMVSDIDRKVMITLEYLF
jgi:iron complex outermembrane receptor protein